MRFLLLNPPVPNRALTNRDLMGGMGIDDAFGVSLAGRFLAFAKSEGIRLPVLSLGYAAAVLRAAGHEVVHRDLSRRDPSEAGVLNELVALQPDWVIAATSFGFLRAELAFLTALRDQTGCQRLLLGQTASHYAREILQRGLGEAIALGDPEVAVGLIAAGAELRGAAGVATKDLDAGVPWVGKPAFVPSLDALPWPDWTSLDRSAYSYFPLLRRTPFVTILGSRGCPYACSFCPYPVAQGKPFRPRAVQDVLAEIAFRVQHEGVRALLFRDPTFSLDLTRAKQIAQGIKDLGVDLQWGIETRLDRLDDALMDLLGASGCRSVTFGIDPLDHDVRSTNHRKGYQAARAAEQLRRLAGHGIATAGLYVVGLPGQSETQIHQDFEWLCAQDLTYLNMEVATVFPGTPMYEEAIAKRWIEPVMLDDLLTGEPKLRWNGHLPDATARLMQDKGLQRFYRTPRRVWRELAGADAALSARFYLRTALRFARQEAAGMATHP